MCLQHVVVVNYPWIKRCLTLIDGNHIKYVIKNKEKLPIQARRYVCVLPIIHDYRHILYILSMECRARGRDTKEPNTKVVKRNF